MSTLAVILVPRCPRCGSSDITPMMGGRYYLCNNCGLRFITPLLGSVQDTLENLVAQAEAPQGE